MDLTSSVRQGATILPVHARNPALLLLVGLAIQLPWMFAPFGFFELNAGYFFGPFAQSFERFGFGTLRGVPLGAYAFIPAEPSAGYPYFNHPPGSAWVMSVLGSAEWQIRLPCVVATLACGVLLYLLLRKRLGDWPAFSAGCLALVMPVLAFGGQVTYESLVLAVGLLLWLSFLRVQAGERGWQPVLWGTAFVGPWLDWGFGFFVLALLPLGVTTSLRRSCRRLAAPWLLALASVGGIMLWSVWARAAPFLKEGNPPGEPVGSMLDRALLNWPPIAQFMSKMADRLCDGFTLPVLVVAAVGVVCWARLDKRLMLAALVPGVLNIALFPSHSSTHLMFSCYLVPVAVAGLASLLHAGRGLPLARFVLPAAFLALASLPLLSTISFRRSAALPVFAELGRTLSVLAEEETTDPRGRENVVATNAIQNYPYYVSSRRVYLIPLADPAGIEGARNGPARVRFVYLGTELYVHDVRTISSINPALRGYLERSPRRPLPQLLGEWPLGPAARVVVRDAWVFDL